MGEGIPAETINDFMLSIRECHSSFQSLSSLQNGQRRRTCNKVVMIGHLIRESYVAHVTKMDQSEGRMFASHCGAILDTAKN